MTLDWDAEHSQDSQYSVASSAPPSPWQRGDANPLATDSEPDPSDHTPVPSESESDMDVESRGGSDGEGEGEGRNVFEKFGKGSEREEDAALALLRMHEVLMLCPCSEWLTT